MDVRRPILTERQRGREIDRLYGDRQINDVQSNCY